MALQKQSIPINFAQGLGQKIDPKQLPLGKFELLENTVFNKIGLLQKRNGFGNFTILNSSNLSGLTTYSNSLVALGSTLNIFSEMQNQWVNKGSVNQVSLTTLSLVRSSSSQSSVDAALASNGLSCQAWVDSDGTCKYQVNDSINGQVLLNAVSLPSGSNAPRVFALNSYFIVTFLITESATPKLKYVAIPLNNLSVPSAATQVSATVKTNTTGYDGMVFNSVLYLAWNGSDGGGAIRFTSLTNSLVLSSAVAISGFNGDLISITINPSNSNIWISFWDSGTTNIKVTLLNQFGTTILAPTTASTGNTITHLTSIVQSNVLNLMYEIVSNYPSGVNSNLVRTKTVTSAGVVGTSTVVLRSVGLASKPFIKNSTIYVMVTYGGSFQPTYFITNLLGNIQTKLAYSNGGGYISTQVLPNVSFTTSGLVYIPYRYKDLLLSVSKANASSDSSNIYSQTGINAVTLNFNTPALSCEIGSDLILSGGVVTSYDGASPSEQGFNVWPEDITALSSISGGGLKAQVYFYQVTYEWTDNQGNLFRSAPSVPLKTTVTSGTPITFTSTFAFGASSIPVSSATGLFVGQVITDSTTAGNIQAGTYITSINGTTIGLSLPTAGASGSPDTLSTSTVGKSVLVIPTLRLTSKSNVRIVVYRWSNDNQSYYQTTSITSPLLNDPTVDTVSFTDTNGDGAILGNPLIYTTGGVVENIAPPSSKIMTLYKSRLMLLDAEDENLVWYSKQVIEGTPVEMSDLFTIYIAPTTGVSKSTGKTTALGAMDDKFITFKKDAAYYITGDGPDNTGGNGGFSDPIFIAGTVGCTNQNSVVLMPAGLMFQSDKGIWLLDRNLGTSYIGADVEDYTESALVVSSLVIPGTNQIRFTLDSGVTLMYDYYAQQWGVFTGIPAISSVVYGGLHTYLRNDGSIFQETPDLYLDGSKPVLINLRTSWLSLTGLQGFQRAYEYYILGTYITPHFLTVQTGYDYNSNPVQTETIMPDNYTPNWGGESTWGGGEFWGGNGNLEQWRINLERQKCQSIQISITEQYDPSFGVPAGAGLTLSGINLIVGAKSSYPRLKPGNIA